MPLRLLTVRSKHAGHQDRFTRAKTPDFIIDILLESFFKSGILRGDRAL